MFWHIAHLRAFISEWMLEQSPKHENLPARYLRSLKRSRRILTKFHARCLSDRLPDKVAPSDILVSDIRCNGLSNPLNYCVTEKDSKDCYYCRDSADSRLNFL